MQPPPHDVGKGVHQLAIQRMGKGADDLAHSDLLAVEEPLEINLAYGPVGSRQHRSLAVTMRTPGQDTELALGFLFTEGIIGRAEDVEQIRHVGQSLAPEASENVLLASLSAQLPLDFERFGRHFYTSSSCGVCGKSSIEMVRTVTCYYPQPGWPQVQVSTLCKLPDLLAGEQSLFAHTGGIHAAGVFDASGRLLWLREDVGRHNAMDKLIGAALQKRQLPLRNQLVLVSGRLSFELVQKAAMAGVPILAAVGAPSSLAVALAEEHGMTLIGFLRDQRFNVYCGGERIVSDQVFGEDEATQLAPA